jgi:hypothetical protein
LNSRSFANKPISYSSQEDTEEKTVNLELEINKEYEALIAQLAENKYTLKDQSQIDQTVQVLYNLSTLGDIETK